MTGGEQADRSPRNQPRKSFWDRSGGSDSPNGSIHRTFRAVFEMPITKNHQYLTRLRRRQYHNPIHLALQWQRALTLGEYPSPAALAYYLGVSRARITQILNLLKLPPEVIKTIHALCDPISAHLITERSLRPLLALSADQQKAHIGIMLSHSNISL